MGNHVTALDTNGQSNEAGNEANASIPTIYLTSRADVKMWQGPVTGFVDLKNNTNTYPQINAGLHACEFARNWKLVNGIGYDVWNIKYAEGGTSMYDYWKVGGSLYVAWKANLTTALAAITSAGKTYTLRGLICQGEHDSNDLTRANAYHALFAAHLYDRLSSFPYESFLVVKTKADLGPVGGFNWTSIVRAAQEQCVADIQNGVVVIPGFDGSKIGIIETNGINDGNLHFGEPGYTTLGDLEAQWFIDNL